MVDHDEQSRDCVFLILSKGSLRNSDSFEAVMSLLVSSLKQRMSLGAGDIQSSGYVERQETGSLHFHFLLSFSEQVCQSYESAREKFGLPEVYNQSVNTVLPEQGESIGPLVEKVCSVLEEHQDHRNRRSQRVLESPEECRCLDYCLDVIPTSRFLDTCPCQHHRDEYPDHVSQCLGG
jgi:hypothetical protein